MIILREGAHAIHAGGYMDFPRPDLLASWQPDVLHPPGPLAPGSHAPPAPRPRHPRPDSLVED